MQSGQHSMLLESSKENHNIFHVFKFFIMMMWISFNNLISFHFMVPKGTILKNIDFHLYNVRNQTWCEISHSYFMTVSQSDSPQRK